MSAPTPTLHRTGIKRAAFTLVELLAVMTVIAILAGLLTPVVIASFRTAQEATISMENERLSGAIESFKNKYGFYPPTIGSDPNFEINTPAKMLRYLNLISPNHNELQPVGAAATRLTDWWAQVGSRLNERSSLVFWMSGLCKNKQYPLSGQPTYNLALAPFNTPAHFDGSAYMPNVVVERDVYFEFEEGRLLVTVPADPMDPYPAFHQAHGDNTRPGSVGPTMQSTAYAYLDFKSYGFGGYHDGATPTPTFLNPTTFQLVSPGIDGNLGAAGSVFAAGAAGDDNICNFAVGRLDKYVNDNQ